MAEPTQPKTPPKRQNTRDRKAPVVLKKGTADATGPRAPLPRKPVGGRGRDDEPVKKASFVGGPRNEHGTRVARRIECTKCGTVDHVPYVPRDESRALCRSCAAEVLKTYEAGVKVRTPTRKEVCNLCGVPFELPVTVEDDGDPLCPSCLRGFTSWQGSVDVPFAERTKAVVEERLSGALVRKRKK